MVFMSSFMYVVECCDKTWYTGYTTDIVRRIKTHNVKKGVSYPATLITTGDHDDRVVPAHSFKFAAELQAKQTDNNPILIRIETNAGHGAGTPVSKTIEQNADLQAFTLWNMGIKK